MRFNFAARKVFRKFEAIVMIFTSFVQHIASPYGTVYFEFFQVDLYSFVLCNPKYFPAIKNAFILEIISLTEL